MNKPILDYLWDALDELLVPLGIGKTELAGLAIIIISVLVSFELLPPTIGEWLKQNWKEWAAVAFAGGLLGVRHAIRKGPGNPNARLKGKKICGK